MTEIHGPRFGAFMRAGGSERVFYGWFVVAASFLCWFSADAFGWYTFGIFIGPISRDLGWTTVTLTGALTLRVVVGGLLGPVIGPLVDTKHGARVLMSLGVLIAGAVPLAVSHITEVWQFYLLYGVVGALGMVGYGGLVTNALISKWFVRKRGRAIGIATMGISMSGLVFVPLSHLLISNFGWRTALLVLGFTVWGLAFIPVVLLVRRRPEDIDLRPDGDGAEESEADNITEAHGASSREEIWTLKEALRTRALWVLLIGFNITGLALSGVFIHFYPYLESKGIPPNIAATAVTTFAFCCAAVKIPWGLLAERLPVRYCITACYVGCALSLLILIYSHSVAMVFVYAIMYGVTLGGDMVLKELVWANYFGRTFLGTIRGVTMPANLFSAAGGPLFAAWLRDVTGSYQLPYTIFLFAALIGTCFIFLARPPVKQPILTAPEGGLQR
jgi:OFA family oxalate/formate antiporter-like MFS transporter